MNRGRCNHVKGKWVREERGRHTSWTTFTLLHTNAYKVARWWDLKKGVFQWRRTRKKGEGERLLCLMDERKTKEKSPPTHYTTLHLKARQTGFSWWSWTHQSTRGCHTDEIRAHMKGDDITWSIHDRERTEHWSNEIYSLPSKLFLICIYKWPSTSHFLSDWLILITIKLLWTGPSAAVWAWYC